MKRSKNEGENSEKRPILSAMTEEGREKELINLAYERVADRIRNDKATSAELVHFLRLGSSKEEMEKELLKTKTELSQARADAIKYERERELAYDKVLDAIKSYGSRGVRE